MSKTQKIEFSHFSWINIINPTEKNMDQLREQYQFHPLDLQDCLTVGHRSKVDLYPNYAFIVLIFPYYNRETREIKSAELDFFISSKYIITIHDGALGVFNEFFNLFQVTSHLRDQYTESSPEKLLYAILNKLFLYLLPMIDHLNQDCDRIEEAIFSGREKQMVSEILIIRRNITDFRKITQVHKNVLKKITYYLKDSRLYAIKKSDAYFESLIDETKEIWDNLENLKERIEALQQTNESQISFRLSDIMKTLTVISFITFPVMLVAAIFGMNATHSMPFVNTEYGFLYILGLMILMIIGMVLLFRKKGWF